MIARIDWWSTTIARIRWWTDLAHAALCPGHSAPADDAGENREQDQTAHTDTDADHDLLVLLDPAQCRRAHALARFAVAASVAWSAVQVILVHFDASSGAVG